MKNRNGWVEAIGILAPTLLAIAIGWWGLTQFGASVFTGLAALGFACFLFTPAAWIGGHGYGLALSGSAGAVMMVLAAILGSLHL
jgi:hypothetical protein